MNTMKMKSFNPFAHVVFAVWLASCGGGSLNNGTQPGTAGTVGTGQGGALGWAGSGEPGGGGSGVGTAGTGGDGIGGSGGTAVIAGSRGGYTCTGTGAGGIEGTLALSGRGGPSNCPASPPPTCGAAVCGNGQLDSCDKAATDFCLPRTDTEECDGSNLGGASCFSRGYGSGPLACTPSCGFDVAACTECAAQGSVLTGCRLLPFAADGAGSIALGASDTEIGMALLNIDSANPPPLAFARFAPNLDLIDTTVLEAVAPRWCDHRWVGAAVAPLATGWVVAIAGDPEVFVHVLDASGRSVARVVVDMLPPHASTGDPILVTRPGGGPLLAWPTDFGVRTSVISEDGRSFTPPITLPLPAELKYYRIGATYLSGDFYVLHKQPFYIDAVLGPRRGFTLARVDTKGRLVSKSNVLADEDMALAGLAAGPDDLRLLYSSTTAEMVGGRSDYPVRFRRITPAGEPLTPAVALGYRQDFGPAAAFAAGGDTLALFGAFEDPGYSSRLGFARLAADGTRVGADQMIVRVPNQVYLESPVATRRGPDVVVAWKKNFMMKGISIARVTP